ncbi:MAG: superoxide dismutase [Alphaproteobacteria bacterium]|nr:MAG: superoxide dismutase [Alphaproteobacteria bacterium]
MTFTLPALPFARDALGKFMSAETLDFHHGKHHKAYVDKANALIADKGIETRSLVETIRSAKEQGDTGLFNNAAQIWNHSFFWQCLAPPEGQRPSGKLAAMIEEDFGTAEQLLARLKDEAVGHFASGWAWLVLDGGRLRITSLHDADTPAVHDGMKPLLTLDVWEHAYYIDYRNERPRFAESVLGNIVNWDFVGRNLDGEGLERADQDAGALAEA